MGLWCDNCLIIRIACCESSGIARSLPTFPGSGALSLFFSPLAFNTRTGRAALVCR
jgi:hypothetical protein